MIETKPQPLNSGLFRLDRIFAIAFFAFGALMVAFGVLAMRVQSDEAPFAALGFVFFPLGFLHWYAAKGAQLGKTSGKVVSRIIGTLSLFGFPIGTALGIYVWVKTSQWRSEANIPPAL